MFAVIDGHRGKGFTHPVEGTPVSSRVQHVQKSSEAEQHRASANCRQGFHLRGASAQPVEHDWVLQLLPGAPSARAEEDIEPWATVERIMGQDFHTARGSDWAWFLRNQQYLKWRAFVAAFLFVHPCCREHFKRAAKVQDFDVLEQDDTNEFSFHLNLAKLRAQ